MALVTVTRHSDHWPAAGTGDATLPLDSCSAVFEQWSRFTAASIAIVTTDTGETQARKVGHEISSDVINTESYTYHFEWW